MDNEDNDEPKSGWVAMWQTIGLIVFFLLCFAYCTRAEIVEIMK